MNARERVDGRATPAFIVAPIFVLASTIFFKICRYRIVSASACSHGRLSSCHVHTSRTRSKVDAKLRIEQQVEDPENIDDTKAELDDAFCTTFNTR